MGKRKRYREKRAHLKPLSAERVRVPRRANPQIMKQYHDAVASVIGPKHQVIPDFNGPFMQDVPKTKGLQEASDDHDWEWEALEGGRWVKVKKTPAHQEMADKRKAERTAIDTAIERLHLVWQSDFRQGINDFHHVVWVRSAKHILCLFFSGAQHIWVRFQDGYAKRSIIYSSRDRAEFALRSETITWIDSWVLPSA